MKKKWLIRECKIYTYIEATKAQHNEQLDILTLEFVPVNVAHMTCFVQPETKHHVLYNHLHHYSFKSALGGRTIVEGVESSHSQVSLKASNFIWITTTCTISVQYTYQYVGEEY